MLQTDRTVDRADPLMNQYRARIIIDPVRPVNPSANPPPIRGPQKHFADRSSEPPVWPLFYSHLWHRRLAGGYGMRLSPVQVMKQSLGRDPKGSAIAASRTTVPPSASGPKKAGVAPR